VNRSRFRARAAALNAAAAASLIAAAIYYLMGFEVVRVVSDAPATASILAFGVAAGTAMVLAAALLILVHRRWIWALVAGFQVLTLGWYVAVAPLRDPPVELWGLLVGLVELFILVALTYLLIQRGAESTRPTHPSRSSPQTASGEGTAGPIGREAPI
jgi:hydrogenase-4 membrane subunit HyfE